MVVGITLRVVPLEFLLKVEFPIGVEVSADAQRAEAQHGLSAGEGPAGATSVHAVFDEVSTRSLDDTRRDGKPHRDGLAVLHVVGIRIQIISGVLDGRSRTTLQLCAFLPYGRDCPITIYLS